LEGCTTNYELRAPPTARAEKLKFSSGLGRFLPARPDGRNPCSVFHSIVGDPVFQSIRTRAAALLLSSFFTLTGAAFAQKQADSPAEKADEAAIHDYILTMPKIETYAAASKDMAAVQKDPAIASEANRLEADEKSSMLEKVRMIETTCPHMNAWIKAHGMNAREFMLIPMTLMTTGLAAYAKDQGGKDVAFVNPVNIAFYRQHKADIEKLNIQAPSGDDSQ
jgi:hypothetical protein